MVYGVKMKQLLIFFLLVGSLQAQNILLMSTGVTPDTTYSAEYIDSAYNRDMTSVYDYDFAANITDWSGSGTEAWYSVDDSSVGRVNCLIQTATGTNANMATSFADYIQGQRYKYSYLYYIPSSNTTTVKIMPRFYRSGATQNLEVRSVIDAWTASQEFVTADTNYITISYYQLNAANSLTGATVGDVVYLDDVVLTPTDYVENGSVVITFVDSQMVITASGHTAADYVSLAQSNLSSLLEHGSDYYISFDVSSSASSDIRFKVGNDSSDVSTTTSLVTNNWIVTYDSTGYGATGNPLQLLPQVDDTYTVDNISIKKRTID